jgi:glutathione S-transferase
MIKFFFGAISPYTRKVHILLKEKQLPFETVPVDLANPTPDFLAVNPNLRIPAISDGDVHLFESNVILDYLLSTYPQPSPDNPPLGKALVRPEHRWEDTKTLVTIETVLDSGLNIFQFARNDIGPEQAPYLQRELDRIQSDLDWLETKATPEGFVPGEFSLLDLNLVCTLQWADFRKPFQWQGRPKLEAIVALHGERESIASTRPQTP